MTVNWDYSELARHYDKRADYAPELVSALVKLAGFESETAVADVGAGTGKLTVPLLERGLRVAAIEPNDEMRRIGVLNTSGQTVTWSSGRAEETGLATASVSGFFMGSSFNVVGQEACLREAGRVLKPGGSFACLWNHRNLDDPVQREIEKIIRSKIPDYNYGSRRENPSSMIRSVALFTPVIHLACDFVTLMKQEDVIEAWRSHATLQRQADEEFEGIIAEIADFIKSLGKTDIEIPYTTRAWICQKS